MAPSEGSADNGNDHRYRQIFEQAGAAFLLTELHSSEERIELQTVDCNQSAQLLFGRDRDQLMCCLAHDLSPAEQPDGRSSLDSLLDWAAAAIVGGPQVFAWRFLHRDGHQLDTEVCFAGMELDGRCYLHATVRDVSETKRLQAALLQNQRLESIGRLAGGIAHNLNTALSPIVLAVDRIRLMTDDARIHERLETIDECADRATSLVRQVVAFAHGVRDENVAVQPADLMERIAAFLQLTFPRSISVSYRAEPGVWPVLGVPGQLEQVLLHLCLNAREAIKEASPGEIPEGQIFLSVENRVLGRDGVAAWPQVQPGRFVVMTVRDSGCGITTEELERIFDPFYTSKHPGVGLGLSAVNGIVTGHGGFVTVSSEPDAGSELQVHLPALDEHGNG